MQSSAPIPAHAALVFYSGVVVFVPYSGPAGGAPQVPVDLNRIAAPDANHARMFLTQTPLEVVVQVQALRTLVRYVRGALGRPDFDLFNVRVVQPRRGNHIHEFAVEDASVARDVSELLDQSVLFELQGMWVSTNDEGRALLRRYVDSTQIVSVPGAPVRLARVQHIPAPSDAAQA